MASKEEVDSQDAGKWHTHTQKKKRLTQDKLLCSGKGPSTGNSEASGENVPELELWMEILFHLSHIRL